MNGNEPAFPTFGIVAENKTILHCGNDGLTKREWLAGMAMQAKLTYAGHVDAGDIRDCVVYADKLLAELDKAEKGGA